MRILIITATYVPSINGIAITLLQQKEELEKRGHDVTLVAPYHQDGNIEKNVIRVPSLPNPFASDYPIPVPFIRSLESYRKIRKAEIIYFHHPFYMGKLSLMLAKSWKVPSVFFYHTQYKKYTQNFLPNNYLFKHIPDLVNRQVKNIINSSDAVIVETNSVLDELKKQGIKVKSFECIFYTVYDKKTLRELSMTLPALMKVFPYKTDDESRLFLPCVFFCTIQVI